MFWFMRNKKRNFKADNGSVVSVFFLKFIIVALLVFYEWSGIILVYFMPPPSSKHAHTHTHTVERTE